MFEIYVLFWCRSLFGFKFSTNLFRDVKLGLLQCRQRLRSLDKSELQWLCKRKKLQLLQRTLYVLGFSQRVISVLVNPLFFPNIFASYSCLSYTIIFVTVNTGSKIKWRDENYCSIYRSTSSMLPESAAYIQQHRLEWRRQVLHAWLSKAILQTVTLVIQLNGVLLLLTNDYGSRNCSTNLSMLCSNLQVGNLHFLTIMKIVECIFLAMYSKLWEVDALMTLHQPCLHTAWICYC